MWETALIGAIAGGVVSLIVTPIAARKINRETTDDALLGEILTEFHLARECLDRHYTVDGPTAGKRALEGWGHVRRAGSLGVQLSPSYSQLRPMFADWMYATPDDDTENRLIGVADGLLDLSELPNPKWPEEIRTNMIVYQDLLAQIRGEAWLPYSTRFNRWRLRRRYQKKAEDSGEDSPD